MSARVFWVFVSLAMVLTVVAVSCWMAMVAAPLSL
jgi:hypothetical protein